jgi:L-ascorbate metabolism protein UlaG (beta-lactamase superfamily)
MATSITWLGHASFRMDSPGGKRIYVDPFLDGNPKTPDSEKEPERCDAIVLTHGHGDHLGDTIAIHEQFDCPVLAQVELRAWLTQNGVADDGGAYGPNKGGTVSVEGVKVTLTHANHSSSTPDGSYTGESCGVVFTFEDGFRIYFAGDTNVFGDMSLIARIYSPDVAVIPIGGHFTMDPTEAAVALELLDVKRCIPSHYGTFPLLTGTAEELRKLAPAGVEIITPDPGETVDL